MKLQCLIFCFIFIIQPYILSAIENGARQLTGRSKRSLFNKPHWERKEQFDHFTKFYDSYEYDYDSSDYVLDSEEEDLDEYGEDLLVFQAARNLRTSPHLRLFVLSGDGENCIDNYYGPAFKFPYPRDDQIETTPCVWDVSQSWHVAFPPSDPHGFEPWFALTSLFSGYCLELSGGRNEDDSPVGVFDCHYGSNQLWRTINTGEPGGIYLENKRSGKCLTILDIPESPGGVLGVFKCISKGKGRQLWTFEYR